jgi:hypothetical protein
MARLVPEWLRFGDVPVGARAHRVVVLVNDRGAPTRGVSGGGGGRGTRGLEGVAGAEDAAGRIAMNIGRSAGFGTGGGAVVFAWDESHPLLGRGGPLAVHPMKGRLEPGETAVCRVTITAGAHPMVLEMDLPVAVAVPEDEMVARVSVARKRAAAAAFTEQQAAARKPPEPTHVPVALKSTSARNARIQTAAAEKHLRTTFKERGSAGDVASVAQSRSDRRQRQTREAQTGTADDASVLGRRAGSGLATDIPAAVALGAGRKGMRAEDIGSHGSAGGATGGGGMPSRPTDAAEARVAGVVAAVREALDTAATGPGGGSADDATQVGRGGGGGGKSAAGRSVASSRSRLSVAKATAAVDAAAASVPTPVPPATTLSVHLSARVCGEDEFRQAHGSSRLASFLRAPAMGAAEAGLPELHGEANRQQVPDADEELRGGAAVEADVDAAPQAVAGAGGGTQGRHVMQAVLTDLLAELVSGADVAQSQGGSAGAQVPTFRELAARRGRSVHGHAQDGQAEASAGADAAKARSKALRSGQVRRLCSKFVHTTLHNIARDAAAGAVDFSKLPTPMVTLGAILH